MYAENGELVVLAPQRGLPLAAEPRARFPLFSLCPVMFGQVLHLGKQLAMQREQKVRALPGTARTVPSLAHTIQALRRIGDPRTVASPVRRPQSR